MAKQRNNYDDLVKPRPVRLNANKVKSRPARKHKSKRKQDHSAHKQNKQQDNKKQNKKDNQQKNNKHNQQAKARSKSKPKRMQNKKKYRANRFADKDYLAAVETTEDIEKEISQIEKEIQLDIDSIRNIRL